MRNNKDKNTIPNHHNTKSSKKNQTRIKDWTKYNKALKKRASVTLLVSPEVFIKPRKNGQPGRPKTYSDAVILFLLELREIFQLPFRQTVGLAESLATIGALPLPEYNTLCTRMHKLNIKQNIAYRKNRVVCLLVDSTGLKTKGEGEWKVRKHGAGYRRGWKKLHIGVDYNTQVITAHEVTSERVVDQEAVIPLLDQTTKNGSIVKQLIGDGAYNSHRLYQEIENKRSADLLSPPRKNAKLHVKFSTTHPGRGGSGGKYADFVDEKGWETHNQYLRDCIHLGWDEWKNRAGYHKRSLVETAMWRLKSAFSDKLKSKSESNVQVEIALRINLLNHWTIQSQANYRKI